MMIRSAVGGKHKRNYEKWRAISLSAVYLLMGIHIAHWKLAGQTLAPLELNEVLYTLHLGVITAGFIFMGLAMVSTLVAGRFFCGWMCHIVALQDLSEWILAKMRIKPKHIRSRTLVFVPFIAMAYMFIMPQVERIYKGLPALSLKVQTDSDGWASFVTQDFWRNLPGIGITLFTFFICGFLIIYLLGSRSFCSYACPYGALFSMSDKVAPGKIKLTGDCNQCGICTSVCSSHIQVHHEVKHFGKVVNSNCLKDLDCVSVCPNDALSYGFTKPSFFQSLKNIKSIKKRYDFTLKEDIMLLSLFGIFLMMFFGLYDSIAFLLAVALAIILAYSVIKTKRLLTKEYSRIGNLVLKQSNKTTFAGKLYLAVFSMLMLFSAHSIYIRYHQLSGEYYYNQYLKEQHQLTDSSHHHDHFIQLANDHLQKTYHAGIYQSAGLLRQLASLAMSEKKNTEAIIYLEKMVNKLPTDLEARLKLSKLHILNGDQDKAYHLLRNVSGINAITVHEKQLKSDALVTIGHLEEKRGFASEAVILYSQALESDPGNPEAHLAIGVLLTKAGDTRSAEGHLLKAASHYKNSPMIDNNLAVVYLKQQRFDLARKHLISVVQMQPDNITAKYNLAMTHYKTGNRELAIIELETIIAMAPGHQNAKIALSKITHQRSSQ